MKRSVLAGAAACSIYWAGHSAAQSAYSTGAVPTPPDIYAAIPELPRARSDILLSSVDLSPMFPPAGSQGSQGSCTGWAIAYASRSYYLAALADDRPNTSQEIASPAFQYNFTALQSPNDNPNCGGAYYSEGLDFARDTGSIPLSEWPYGDTCLPKKATQSELDRAAQFRIPDYRRFALSEVKSIEAYKEALQEGHPVMIAAVIHADDWNDFRGGGVYEVPQNVVVPPPRYNDPIWGYHAMVAVGFDDTRNAIKLMNSWGDNWGDNGLIWIDYDTFLRSTKEAYVMIGMEPAIRPLEALIDPTPPDPNAETRDILTAAIEKYPSLVLKVIEKGDKFHVEGHGCASSAARVRRVSVFKRLRHSDVFGSGEIGSSVLV